MGTELAGAICGLTLVGYWVDRHYGTGNTGVIIGASIGVVGGMYNFLRQALALSRSTESAAQRQREARRDADGSEDRNAS